MKENTWRDKGFIGHQLLTSNHKDINYQLYFLGAEANQFNTDKDFNTVKDFKVHLMISQQISKEFRPMQISTANNGIGYSLTVAEGEEIRFEGYWGVHREITFEYTPEDYGFCNRFLRVKSIKFLKIEKDFIEYEVCC